MKKIIYEKKIPEQSIIKDMSFLETNYEDAISIDLPANPDYRIDDMASLFFTSSPAWVDSLLKLRNILVKPLGLRTGNTDNFKRIEPGIQYEPGGHVGFFTVIKRTDNELVMGENDKHLNFRTSVMLLPSDKTGPVKFYSMTIVKFNNCLGKFYFFPVKYFHKWIIKASLEITRKNLIKNLSK